jgi:hypothetical protein
MDNVEPDYDLEDHASRFESNPSGHGNYALILRLSSDVKNPASGFAFGRNTNRCDVVFTHDPYKRVSNIHFRIYVNEYGNVMVEDQSTNGTFVDRALLLSRSKDPLKPPITRRVLVSGSLIKILLHNESKDLTFRVRIPRRDDEYAGAYNTKVAEYFVRNKLARESDTIRPSDKGPPDIFRTAAENAGGGHRPKETTPARSINKRGETIRPEWNGSGKYNRVGMIGKGAFAVVYKVTSKYDGRPYAAKELEKRRFIKNGVLDQKVENEMKIMQRVEHVCLPSPPFFFPQERFLLTVTFSSQILFGTSSISTGMSAFSSSLWSMFPVVTWESSSRKRAPSRKIWSSRWPGSFWMP